jgi:hypothetical protein
MCISACGELLRIVSSVALPKCFDWDADGTCSEHYEDHEEQCLAVAVAVAAIHMSNEARQIYSRWPKPSMEGSTAQWNLVVCNQAMRSHQVQRLITYGSGALIDVTFCDASFCYLPPDHLQQ